MHIEYTQGAENKSILLSAFCSADDAHWFIIRIIVVVVVDDDDDAVAWAAVMATYISILLFFNET